VTVETMPPPITTHVYFATTLGNKDNPIHLGAKTFNNELMLENDSNPFMKAFNKLSPPS
jgi:hypothetical protein